jgi:hypothetical protein
MKVTDQSVPPELQTDYDQLAVNQFDLGGGQQALRTAKKVHRTKSPRRLRKVLRDYEEAAAYIAQLMEIRTGKQVAADFELDIVYAIRAGNFDPQYWVECEPLSDDVLSCVPTCTTYTGSRDYAYPDPTRQPSDVIFPAGTPAEGEASYTGSVSDERYNDTLLRWRRLNFDLDDYFPCDDYQPCFVKITGTISASANLRACRSFLSAWIKHWLCIDGSGRPATVEAPSTDPIWAYYRYITPRGDAPFYNLTNDVRLIYTMRSEKYEETGGDLTTLTLLVSPMPTSGHRFNNNDIVQTDFSFSVSAYQARTGGQFTILHTDGYHLASSDDGVTWYPRSLPIGYGAKFIICPGRRFAALKGTYDNIEFSKHTNTLTEKPVSGTHGSFDEIVTAARLGNQQRIFSNRLIYQISGTNGDDWTYLIRTANLTGPIVLGGRCYAIDGPANNGSLKYSSDFETWSLVQKDGSFTVAGNPIFSFLLNGGAGWISYGTPNFYILSSSAGTYAYRYIGNLIPGNCRGAASVLGTICTAHANGAICTSTDTGISWSVNYPDPTNPVWKGLLSDGFRFVAWAANGRIATSIDGKIWELSDLSGAMAPSQFWKMGCVPF